MDELPLAEIEFRLALLPPISRGAHLAGPRLHAERLIELWRADGDVPLGQAFRLLDAEAVAAVILHMVAERDYGSDPQHWHFPPFTDLLQPLREAAWQEILAGKLVLEAIKGVIGRRYRPLAPALLPRLTSDWELSRLIRDGRDEYIEVRVRRPIPATAIPRPWQPKLSPEDIKMAVETIAQAHPPPAWLPFPEFWAKLKALLGPEVTKRVAINALKHAPHLRGKRGQRRKIKSRD